MSRTFARLSASKTALAIDPGILTTDMKPISCGLPSKRVMCLEYSNQKLVFLGVSHSAFGAPIVYGISSSAFSLDHQFLGSLGVRHERPRCRTAEQRDELAPPHVWHGLSSLPFWREPMSYSTSRSACRRALGESL